jgi:branched-chain amino acid transport system ATP-binding protein
VDVYGSFPGPLREWLSRGFSATPLVNYSWNPFLFEETMANLKLENASLHFGGVQALHQVDLEIRERGIYSLIGPNGSGKTSLVNCITGFYKPQAGSIQFEGQELVGMRPHAIAKLGIARTFQNIELFRGMSVLDNIKLGRLIYSQLGVLTAGLFWGKARQEEIENRRGAEEIIEILEIEDIRKEIVSKLPYGKQKLVELARALVTKPKLLLLDEPTAGMNSEETDDIVRYILDVNAFGNLSILLIEHKMDLIMDVSQRVSVLNFGEKIAEGSPNEISRNPKVIEVYLGEGATALAPGAR